MSLRLCTCGLAMYALELSDGTWTYVCEACDPNLAAAVTMGATSGLSLDDEDGGLA